MNETTETEIKVSSVKGIVVLSIVGVVVILSIVAAFIPESRVYVVDTVKTLLGAISSIVK